MTETDNGRRTTDDGRRLSLTTLHPCVAPATAGRSGTHDAGGRPGRRDRAVNIAQGMSAGSSPAAVDLVSVSLAGLLSLL